MSTEHKSDSCPRCGGQLMGDYDAKFSTSITGLTVEPNPDFYGLVNINVSMDYYSLEEVLVQLIEQVGEEPLFNAVANKRLDDIIKMLVESAGEQKVADAVARFIHPSVLTAAAL